MHMHRVIREYEKPGVLFEDPRRDPDMDARMDGFRVPVYPAGDLAHG